MSQRFAAAAAAAKTTTPSTMLLKNWILGTEKTISSGSPWIRLMDGGVSTHLEELLKGSQGPLAVFSHRALWSSSLLLTESGQDIIRQGHRDWLQAGSDVITTVTYQCHYGTSNRDKELVVSVEKMKELLQTGIHLAQQAVQEYKSETNNSHERFVVASSGCYGAALANGSEYTGDYGNVTLDEIVHFHKGKAKTMLEENPDGLAIETIPSVSECLAVCDALISLQTEMSTTANTKPTELPCSWISLACKDGATLNEGTPFVNALEAIREKDPKAEHVHAIGINCCDSAYAAPLLELLTRDMALHGPRRGIVVYPNSGEEWNAEDETWREGTGCTHADELSDRLMEAIGVVQKTWKTYEPAQPMPKIIVGGCCRTSPSTIAALRQHIDKWHQKQEI